MTEREKLFAAAKVKQKAKREKEDQRFGGSFFEEVVYTALAPAPSPDKAVRIVGVPMEVRETGTDPKTSIISMILGDRDKKFRCIWPNKAEDPSWILWKIYDKILAYDWDKVNRVKKYHNTESHPELFQRVLVNNSTNQFESGWRPGKVVHLNVIDRADMSWHQENSHLKILSKKASESGDRIWFEPGVPESVYNMIWDGIVEYNGDFENYDIVIRKLEADPWYEVFHGIDDRKKIKQEVLDLIREGDLTEEERSWEGYDFDKIFPLTSYTKIKNNLNKFIQKVDLDFNTNYFQELQDFCSIEEKNRKDNPIVQTTPVSNSYTKVEQEEEESEIDLEIKEEPVIKSRSKVKEEKELISWKALADGSYNGRKYEGVLKLTDQEKSMVLSVNEDGSFKYVKELNGVKVVLLNNQSTDFISPESFLFDPISGEEF